MTDAEYDPKRHRAVYNMNYAAAFREIAEGKVEARTGYRWLIQNDLFFIVLFVMGIWAKDNPWKANNPFVVNRCKDVQSGPRDKTLDVWAREHFKSVIITQAETIQDILRNPEECHVIFSYKKPKAEDFLSAIKQTLETEFLRWVFDDILYANPGGDSPSWSLQNGITVKRQAQSRKEKTVEAYGVVEGMPTGGHWERRIYDDIETADLAKNPDQLQYLIQQYEMSRNLGTMGGRERVIGTFYSHCGLLTHLRDKQDINGKPVFRTRIIPATNDGTKTGMPVLLTQEQLDDKKTDTTFNSQQLCNPTPTTDIKLNFDMMKALDPRFFPKDRIKFVIIDPAGDESVQKGGAKNDDWAMVCIGVRPCMDDLGTSDIYIEDGFLDTMPQNTAIDAACRLYMRNGRITGLGVEKVGTDTTYLHIQNALKARGRYVVIKKTESSPGNLVLLNPDGKNKVRRIESSLSWPLCNGKIFYSKNLPVELVNGIKNEMDKFPYFHPNFIDAVSYVYKLMAFMRFSFMTEDEPEDEDDGVSGQTFQGRSAVGGY